MVTRLGLCVGATLLLWSHLTVAARAVTVEEEIPEEILRTEIITGARSPLTGEPLSADEYARLQDELEAPAGGNIVRDDIRYLLFLLQARRSIRPIIPFIP